MRPRQRTKHVRTLAAKHGVAVDFLDPLEGIPLRGMADGMTATATVFGWDASNAAYLVALHEIGHLALGHNPKDPIAWNAVYVSRIVEAEAEAWQWAFDHALESVFARTKNFIRDVCLGSYVRDCGLATAGVAYSTVASQVGLPVAA